MVDHVPPPNLPKPPSDSGGEASHQHFPIAIRLADGLALAANAASIVWLLLGNPVSAVFWWTAVPLLSGLAWLLRGRVSAAVGADRGAPRALELVALVVDMLSIAVLSGTSAQVARLVATAVRAIVWLLRGSKQ